MLGELVEMVLEVEAGQAINPGSRLGTVEGFKAVSDLVSAIDGTFGTRNPLLTSEACLTLSDPYERGWLYTACGEPELGHLDVHGYIAHLHSAWATSASSFTGVQRALGLRERLGLGLFDRQRLDLVRVLGQLLPKYHTRTKHRHR
jgi:hypothetical protein